MSIIKRLPLNGRPPFLSERVVSLMDQLMSGGTSTKVKPIHCVGYGSRVQIAASKSRIRQLRTPKLFQVPTAPKLSHILYQNLTGDSIRLDVAK